MMKKIFALLGGSLLSIMFLAGCGRIMIMTNKNPAPEDDNNIIEDNKNGVNDNNDDNDMNDNDDDGVLDNDDDNDDNNVKTTMITSIMMRMT